MWHGVPAETAIYVRMSGDMAASRLGGERPGVEQGSSAMLSSDVRWESARPVRGPHRRAGDGIDGVMVATAGLEQLSAAQRRAAAALQAAVARRGLALY